MIDDEIVLYEKDINLDIGKRVYESLLEKGYNVIATRTEDTTVSDYFAAVRLSRL